MKFRSLVTHKGWITVILLQLQVDGMDSLTDYGCPDHIIYFARARWALEAPVLKIYSTHALGGKRFTPPSPSRAGPPLRVAKHLT